MLIINQKYGNYQQYVNERFEPGWTKTYDSTFTFLIEGQGEGACTGTL